MAEARPVLSSSGKGVCFWVPWWMGLLDELDGGITGSEMIPRTVASSFPLRP